MSECSSASSGRFRNGTIRDSASVSGSAGASSRLTAGRLPSRAVPARARPSGWFFLAASTTPPSGRSTRDAVSAIRRGTLPAGLLVLVLLPLMLMPLGAVFVFAFRGGFGAFWEVIRSEDAQFALRFSLLIALGTALANGILGTFAAYVLSKYRFYGKKALGVVVNLPV